MNNYTVFCLNGPQNIQVLIALVGWYSKTHRRYLLVTVATLIFGIAYTFVYTYPINELLITKAGGDKSAQ